MSIFEDTSNDEALARALQEEFNNELQPEQPQPPSGTILYTNTIPGPSVRKKHTPGTHSQQFLQPGLAGFQERDLDEQHLIAIVEDGESEDVENDAFIKEQLEINDIDQRLTTNQLYSLNQSVIPKVNLHPQDEIISDDSSDYPAQDLHKHIPVSIKAKQRRDKRLTLLENLDQQRKEREAYIRIVFILNTNVKIRKMKFIPCPKDIKQLLTIGMTS